MKGKHGSSSDQVPLGEPPPAVRQLIWLFQKENWRRHWKAIIAAGIFVGAGLVISLYPRKPSDQPTESQQETAGESDVNLLSPDEITRSIDQAIEHGDKESVTRTLSGLVDSDLKEDECQRVYEKTMRNKDFIYASTIVSACWKGEDQREKRAEIEHEKIKR